MKKKNLVAVAALVGMVSVACSGATPTNSGEEVADQVSQTRRVLVQAEDLAHDYGTQHLGHYLDLRLSDLRAAGLEAPADISVKVRSGHTSYCIEVTNEALPSIHEWRKATATSKAPAPNPADRCVV